MSSISVRAMEDDKIFHKKNNHLIFWNKQQTAQIEGDVEWNITYKISIELQRKKMEKNCCTFKRVLLFKSQVKQNYFKTQYFALKIMEACKKNKQSPKQATFVRSLKENNNKKKAINMSEFSK